MSRDQFYYENEEVNISKKIDLGRLERICKGPEFRTYYYFNGPLPCSVPPGRGPSPRGLYIHFVSPPSHVACMLYSTAKVQPFLLASALPPRAGMGGDDGAVIPAGFGRGGNRGTETLKQ